MAGRNERERKAGKALSLGKWRGRSDQSASRARENLNLQGVATHKKLCEHNDSEVKVAICGI